MANQNVNHVTESKGAPSGADTGPMHFTADELRLLSAALDSHDEWYVQPFPRRRAGSEGDELRALARRIEAELLLVEGREFSAEGGSNG